MKKEATKKRPQPAAATNAILMLRSDGRYLVCLSTVDVDILLYAYTAAVKMICCLFFYALSLFLLLFYLKLRCLN